jgi:hypothetical protein
MSAPDTRQPIFDPGLDVATLVFSHMQCVKTRVNLAVVSKLWRDASKPAAAYPLEFDFDAFPDMHSYFRAWADPLSSLNIRLLDNDEALSLPYERVVGLLDEATEDVCTHAALRGSVRLLKWAREHNLVWSEHTCYCAARNGHLPALKYLHENGCPWYSQTCDIAAENGHLTVLQYLHENGCPWNHGCRWAADHEHWDCVQYMVDNKCPDWKHYAEEYACACAAHTKRWDRLQYLVDNKSPGWKKYVWKYEEHLRYFYAGSGYGSDDSQASM